MDFAYEDFGRLVRRRRDVAGLSQQDLATAVGLSRTSITNIEKGRQAVSLHTLYLLADALGASPAELLPTKTAALPASAELENKLLGAQIQESEKEWIRAVISKSLAGASE